MQLQTTRCRCMLVEPATSVGAFIMLAVPATEQHLMAAVEAVERMHSRYKQAIFS